jgi:hypothetical protein
LNIPHWCKLPREDEQVSCRCIPCSGAGGCQSSSPEWHMGALWGARRGWTIRTKQSINPIISRMISSAITVFIRIIVDCVILSELFHLCVQFPFHFFIGCFVFRLYIFQGVLFTCPLAMIPWLWKNLSTQKCEIYKGIEIFLDCLRNQKIVDQSQTWQKGRNRPDESIGRRVMRRLHNPSRFSAINPTVPSKKRPLDQPVGGEKVSQMMTHEHKEKSWECSQTIRKTRWKLRGMVSTNSGLDLLSGMYSAWLGRLTTETNLRDLPNDSFGHIASLNLISSDLIHLFPVVW